MRVKEALVRGSAISSEASPSAALDAELLLSHLLKLDRLHLMVRAREELSELYERNFFDLVKRRAEGEPVAYIVGEKEFYGLTFKVTPAVLVPRPETELIVERVLELSRGRTDQVQILDLGTGSGCIALSLAHELRARKTSNSIIALDRNADALEIAKENASRLGLDEVIFLQSNWYRALGASRKFDFIVTNPPYVDPGLRAELSKDLSFEPPKALFAEDKGLAAIKEIVRSAQQFLKPAGVLITEIGSEQKSALQSFLSGGLLPEERWYKKIDFLKDLSGQDRALELWRANL